jgi:hypothetical protein
MFVDHVFGFRHFDPKKTAGFKRRPDYDRCQGMDSACKAN